MIPCKVFLQKIEVTPENSKPKISINLNSIFYDEIKPFQAKYFCLTSHDTLTIEAIYEEHNNIVGSASINSPYRLALENQTISICLENHSKSIPIHRVKLSFSFSPVSAYTRKKLGATAKLQGVSHNRQTEREREKDENNYNETTHQLEISFSHRDPLLETHQYMNTGMSMGMNMSIPQLFPNSSDNAVNESLESVEDGESLQSLAQQREKILGELFGRFKRDK